MEVEVGSKLSSPKCFRLGGGEGGNRRIDKRCRGKTASCKQTSLIGTEGLFGDNKREESNKMSQKAVVLLRSSLVLFCG